MSKYIDADKLIAEIERLNSLVPYGSKDRHDDRLHDAYKAVKNVIDSLQQKLDSHSIPVLRADTTEKQNRILEIIGQDDIYCHFPLDFGKETDCGYEDYNDRIYIDGDLTFNKMAEIVDFLSKNSK